MASRARFNGLLTLIAATSAITSVAAAKDCYKNNGDLWVSDPDAYVASWVPCDASADVSVCCSQDDFCLSNGLCMIQNAGDGNSMILSQEGCTDPKWTGACTNYCTAESDDPNGYMFPWSCGDAGWCCGTKDDSCCSTATDFFPITDPTGIQPPVARLAATATAQSSTTSSTTPISRGTTTTSETAVATHSSPARGAADADASSTACAAANQTATECPVAYSSNTNSTRDLAIGLGVGVPIGLAILTALVWVGLQRRKKAAAAATGAEGNNKTAAAAAGYYPNNPGSLYTPSSTTSSMSELYYRQHDLALARHVNAGGFGPQELPHSREAGELAS
ncbi:Uu.00g141370.m01.CDS01 [Anthostomella pinea]|uniref:Uu.00g141370.m01.CDS01 n=1 Tax=Anthostomella pinea TaxID=933095 RepID=A0AAI8VQC8_9PEZI|nr:Uu.00g141370.m01.CDS01 [Anthostomella pinea]